MTNQQNRYAVMFDKMLMSFEFVGVDAKHDSFNRPAAVVLLFGQRTTTITK